MQTRLKRDQDAVSASVKRTNVRLELFRYDRGHAQKGVKARAALGGGRKGGGSFLPGRGNKWTHCFVLHRPEGQTQEPQQPPRPPRSASLLTPATLDSGLYSSSESDNDAADGKKAARPSEGASVSLEFDTKFCTVLCTFAVQSCSVLPIPARCESEENGNFRHLFSQHLLCKTFRNFFLQPLN